MCYQFTSYQFEETLQDFIKTNLDFADQGKRRSQRLDSRSRPKINSGNWSFVVIQKFFLLEKRTSRGSYCHDKWEGLYQTDHSTYVT